MASTAVFESIVSLFLMISVGFYAARKKTIAEDASTVLVNLLIQIILPTMILSSFIYSYDDQIKSEIAKTFYYSLTAYLLMIVISYLLVKPVKGDKKTVLHFANVFPNTGYVGFPVLQAVYGPEGIVYGSVFNLFFVIFVWTYGIIIYRGALNKENLPRELKKTLLNPSVLAVCAGILIMAFDIKLPNALLVSIRNLGSMTGPLSMLIIGMILSGAKVGSFTRDWTLYYGAACKLAVIPLIIYLLAQHTGITSVALNSVIIMTAMPASAMTSIFAHSFDKEKDYAAVVVTLTTVISVVTITLFLKAIL